MTEQKLLVIGLDCASPKFLFDREGFPLPNIHALMDRAEHGILRSCDPPITVPAWACVTTGADPGTLGCYGFRNRIDRSYAQMRVASSQDVRVPRVWDTLGKAGIDSIVLGVPQTYPPRPIRGNLVTGLLTPDTSVQYTYPHELAAEIERVCGEYIIDVPEFRVDALEQTVESLHRMLDNHFAIAEHLITTKAWQFFMFVEIGLDRLHHALWRFADPDHPSHIPNHPMTREFRRYYKRLDDAVGRLISLGPEHSGVMIVSDHGAKPIFGGIRINQWLIDHGYLALKRTPTQPAPLEWDNIDWSSTKAFSSGGYYARIFLNIADREPEGIVSREEAEKFRDKIATELESMPLPGPSLKNTVLFPQKLYKNCNGVAPDLLVYFGDLHYRAVGTVGAESIYADQNDTGPDDANHALEGIYIFDRREGVTGSTEKSIFDLAPAILDWFGVKE